MTRTKAFRLVCCHLHINKALCLVGVWPPRHETALPASLAASCGHVITLANKTTQGVGALTSKTNKRSTVGPSPWVLPSQWSSLLLAGMQMGRLKLKWPILRRCLGTEAPHGRATHKEAASPNGSKETHLSTLPCLPPDFSVKEKNTKSTFFKLL